MKADIKCTLIWRNVEVKDKTIQEKLASWNGECGFEWGEIAHEIVESAGLEDDDADFDYEIDYLDDSEPKTPQPEAEKVEW